MSLKTYGVLKGTVTGHLRDADDDHYQVLITAKGTQHRIAANVLSAAKNAPSIVLFQAKTSVPDALKKGLRKLPEGYKKLASKAGGMAQDYVRGGIVTPSAMKPVPPDKPGVDNDLKDKFEDAIVKALKEDGSVVYAFGEKWGPEKKKKDKYFGFLPGNGIHDIHMNQGNSGKYVRDDGVWQDGAIFIEYPQDKWKAFFMAFQSQTFNTDDEGHAIGGRPTKKKQAKKKAKKKPAKKSKKKKKKKKSKKRKKAKR